MELLRKVLRDRRLHRLAGLGAALGVAMAVLAWRMGLDFGTLKYWWQVAEDFLRQRPWWLFAAIVVLPGLPVPMSALLFLAGTVWREQPVLACAIALTGMALNMSWTYWAAARPARGVVELLLRRSTVRIPKLPRDDQLRTLLILRLTPGIPLFLQNYLLGFLHVPFRLYLPLSVGCSGLVACGVVLSGAGVAGGNFAPAITGVGLIVVGVVVVRWVKAKMLKS